MVRSNEGDCLLNADKALVNTRLVEIEKPRPGPEQVRARLRAASLSPVDWKLASGILFAWVGTGKHVAGVDRAGVVDALGDGISTVGIGERIDVELFGR